MELPCGLVSPSSWSSSGALFVYSSFVLLVVDWFRGFRNFDEGFPTSTSSGSTTLTSFSSTLGGAVPNARPRASSSSVVGFCRPADDRLWKLGEIGERGLGPTALDAFELEPIHSPPPCDRRRPGPCNRPRLPPRTQEALAAAARSPRLWFTARPPDRATPSRVRRPMPQERLRCGRC